MNEQNRQRLGRIAKRHASRMARAQGEAEGDEAFLAELVRVRGEVLRPVMEEIGGQLREEGYEFRVVDAGSEKLPAVELHVVIPGRKDSKDTIRFFAHKDTLRGWQVIAEIELTRSPMELARFDAGDPITREIAEHLIVDATEQMFASALAAPGASAREKGDATASAPRVSPAAANAKAADAEASAAAEGAEGVRALVLGRMRDGRVLHGLDLVGADLHGLDFSGALMPGLDLRRANLRGCVLAGANLVAARLQGADLTDAVLTGANLSRANLSKAVLAGARFDDAVMVDTIGAPPPEPPAPAPEPDAEKVAADLPSPAGQPPAPPPPPESPGRLLIASLPVAKPFAPVLVTEGPSVFAPSRPPVPPRSPLAATSLALDLPIGPALPFAKSAVGTLPQSPSPSGMRDNAAPVPTTLPRVHKAPAALTGTANLPNMPIGPALPFAKSTGAEPPPPPPPAPPSPTSVGDSAPAPVALALPRVQKVPAHLSGTMSVTDLPIAAVLPFTQGAAGDPPALTLEEYAALRANLTVKGEEDAATWKQFGIASLAMKEALQARFAARFRDDAEARDRFVALLQRMMNDLRAKAPGA